jgi:hypothetical protein
VLPIVTYLPAASPARYTSLQAVTNLHSAPFASFETIC